MAQPNNNNFRKISWDSFDHADNQAATQKYSLYRRDPIVADVAADEIRWLNGWVNNRRGIYNHSITDEYINSDYYNGHKSTPTLFGYTPRIFTDISLDRLIQSAKNSGFVYPGEKSYHPEINKFSENTGNYTSGFYSPYEHSVKLNYSKLPTTGLHEIAHSMDRPIGRFSRPSDGPIYSSLNKRGSEVRVGGAPFDPYLDSPPEIFARLMEFRKANNLDPNEKITPIRLAGWRNDKRIKDFELLNRYSDVALSNILNKTL